VVEKVHAAEAANPEDVMAADTKGKGSYEGHGDNSPVPSVSKGEFITSGETWAPLAKEATSVNQKSGNIGDGTTKA
jgi:hypothetical protein